MMQPRTWVFNEPMVVMPVGNVVQAAVTVGNTSPPLRSISQGTTFSEQDARRAAKQMMRGVDHQMSPEDARGEAHRIFQQMQMGQNGQMGQSGQNGQVGQYVVDLHVTSRAVHGSTSGSVPRQQTQAPPHTAHLESENAHLRNRLAESDIRRGQELEEAREEIRNAAALLKQMTAQNMALQAQLAGGAGDAAHTPNKRSSATLRDVIDSAPHNAYVYRSPEPPATAAQYEPPAPYAAPPQQTYPLTQPEVYDNVSRRSSVRSLQPEVYDHSRRSSVRSMQQSAPNDRMARGNTAIACDNDYAEISSAGGSVRSARSIRSLVQEVVQDVAQDVEDDAVSQRSARSARSNASASRARMGKQNTAIACDNDEVELSLDGSEAPTVPPTPVQSLSGPPASLASQSPESNNERMGKQNTAIACDNDEVELSLDSDDDARSIASVRSAKSAKSASPQAADSTKNPPSTATDKGRMGKQNTAIACDNDVLDLDDL